MIFSGVSFPHQIIEAIENKRLVIFAGAGVSMGPPALLPSFWKLAEHLSEGTGLKPSEPLDRFIGMLPQGAQALRIRAANIVSLSSSHTPLHKNLLRTFSCIDAVRVVTTNFDTLFENASSDLWCNSPTLYTAPALPLGSNFKGIVHIHGAINPPESIVLTDSDFGRAYLTEGWARRFLVDLFEHFTVLFVGYSHDDTVLQYLARALPDKAKGKRFSLVGSLETPEKWLPLGVEPVEFSQYDKRDFSLLNSAVSQLADFANRKPSDWQSLIGNIAINLPDKMDVEDEATLRHAFKDVTKVRFFCKNATSPKWIIWLDDERVLDDLFKQSQPSESAQIIAQWLNEHAVDYEPDLVIHLIAKHHFNIGAWFWWLLARHVSQSVSVNGFDKILDVLLQTIPSYVDVHAFHFLAEKCYKLGKFSQTLHIFELMATSKVLIRESSKSQKHIYTVSIRGEIQIASPEWNLNEVWKKCLSKSIDVEFDSILRTTERLLIQRNTQMRIWEKASDKFDGDSLHRSAITNHEQDKYREPLDVIIDATRDCVEKMASVSAEGSKSWINRYHNSTSHLLQRMCIHLISCLKVGADERINLLLGLGLLNKVWRQEAFSVIEGNYADLSEGLRQNLIDNVLQYQSASEEHADIQTAYEHVQWLKVMRKVDADCNLVKRAINKIESVHGEIALQRYPELISWTESGGSSETSPWTVAELLEKGSTDWFKELSEFEGADSFRGPSRSGLLRSIADAARENRDWLFSFANYLVSQKAWDCDIWPYLLRILQDWPNSKIEANEYFILLSHEVLFKNYAREISDILVGAVKSEGVPYICEILDQTNKLAVLLWNILEGSASPVVQSEIDWFISAINTTEGKIAEYWIQALDASNRCGERKLNEPYKSEITRLCDVTDIKTAFSIPVITRQIAFLTNLDQGWAEQFIYPLFSSSDDKRASQAWHGFLNSRGPSDLVFKYLKDAFGGSISRLNSIFLGKEERFIEFYASIALWRLSNPHDAWIPALMVGLPESLRPVFSRKIGFLLKSMKPADIDKAWSSWLRVYWQGRIEGAPCSLSEQDVRAMLEWLPYLENNFSDAISLAIKMEKPKLDHCSFMYQIKSKNLAKRCPDDTAVLIIYLLSCDQKSWSLYKLEDVLKQLPLNEINTQVLSDLNEALIASGRDPLNPEDI